MKKLLTFKTLFNSHRNVYGVGKLSLKRSLNESKTVLKTFVSDSLGKCSVIEEDNVISMYDSHGYVHSVVPINSEDFSGVFKVLPIGGLMNDSNTILMIGLGLGNTYKFFKDFKPESKMVCIEYDKETANITSEIMDIPKEDILVGEGSEIIKSLNGLFDLVILDAYNETTIPEEYQTKEFWEDLKKICTEDVCITVNYCDPDVGETAFKNIHNNISEVFDIDYVLALDGSQTNYVYNYFTKNKNTDLSKYKKGSFDPEKIKEAERKIDYLN